MLLVNQCLILPGDEFVQSQRPVDFAHWSLLFGVLLCLPLNRLPSGRRVGSVATGMLWVGSVALVGQAVIDLCWWSYGNDLKGLNDFVVQLMAEPSIRVPFITIGPVFFYLGMLGPLSRLAGRWSMPMVLGITSVAMIGVGSFVLRERLSILAGHAILTLAIMWMLIALQDQGGPESAAAYGARIESRE